MAMVQIVIIKTAHNRGFLPSLLIPSITISPNSRVKNTLWVLSWLSSHHGISDISAKAKRLSAYFLVERVWPYPSTSKKGEDGERHSSHRPHHVIPPSIMIHQVISDMVHGHGYQRYYLKGTVRQTFPLIKYHTTICFIVSFFCLYPKVQLSSHPPRHWPAWSYDRAWFPSHGRRQTDRSSAGLHTVSPPV